MYIEIYQDNKIEPEVSFSSSDREFITQLEEKLIPFPVNRLKIRKMVNGNPKAVHLHVELDSTIFDEEIYNIIIMRIFRSFAVRLVVLENNLEVSNFDYLFFGEMSFAGYFCSLMVDVPMHAFQREKEGI